MALTPLPASPKLVYMPLIAPPTGGGSYASVPAIGATDNGDLGLQFVLDQATDKTVYAVCNGSVRWLPAGLPLPSGTVASAASVQLAVSADMVQELVKRQPDGLPPLTNFVYQGLDLASFRAVVVAKVAALPGAVLDADWVKTHASDPVLQTQADKQASFVSNVLAGTSTVEVMGGDRLGQVRADANNASAYPLQFSAYEGELVDDPALLGGKINLVVAASPLYFIRYLPDIAQAAAAAWVGHPLLAATSAFTRGAKFYIGFQVSDMAAGPRNPNRSNPDGTHVVDPHYATYVGVEAGSQVLLYDHHTPDTPVATATTNSQGLVYFELTPAQVTGTADFYFVIEAPTTALEVLGTNQPLQLPATWATATSSTDYWLAANGRTKGYLADFKGFQLGNAVAPVWFNIGVDYCFDFSFAMPSPELNSVGTTEGRLPKDLLVQLKTNSGSTIDHLMDGTSSIYGVLFTVKKGEELTFEIPLLLKNLAIGLQQTRVIFPTQIDRDDIVNENLDPAVDPLVTQYWRSKQNQPAPVFASVHQTSMRNAQVTNVNPVDFRIRIDAEYVNDALAFLTYSRELAVFLHYMTGGEYRGTGLNLKLFHLLASLVSGLGSVAKLPAFDQVPLSFPLHSIYFSKKPANRKRELLIHESSHQVMYTTSDFEADDILKRFSSQVYTTGWYHNGTLLSTVFLALTEGWAEALAGIFCGYPEDYCLNMLGDNTISQPEFTKLPGLRDGQYAEVKRYTDGIWLDELTWLYDKSDIHSLALKWRTLDPDINLMPQPEQPARLNRGLASEGAFALLLYTLFWDFVVQAVPATDKRYMVPDPSGDPMQTNGWMTLANQEAISRRFKAFFWEPLKSLAQLPLSEKTSVNFLQSLAQHVRQLPTGDADWGAVRARLFMWNTGFPVSTAQTGPFGLPRLHTDAANHHTGSRSGGNCVIFAGENLIPEYTIFAKRTGSPFRSVYMKLYVGGKEVTDLEVTTVTELSCTIPPGNGAGKVDVLLRLWVRDVEVWTISASNLYEYI